MQQHIGQNVQQQPLHQKQSQHHLPLPSIRVKSEELQRSISSPLVCMLPDLPQGHVTNELFFPLSRHQHEAICPSKPQHVPAIVRHSVRVLRLAAISAGTRLMRTGEFCVARRSITVPSVKRIYASCHVSRNITSGNRPKGTTLRLPRPRRVRSKVSSRARCKSPSWPTENLMFLCPKQKTL